MHGNACVCFKQQETDADDVEDVAPLHMAAMCGLPDVVEILLGDDRTDVNIMTVCSFNFVFAFQNNFTVL